MDIFEEKYKSVSDTFLVPLTGLSRPELFPHNTYMFWKDYSIENYQLILVYEDEDPKALKDHLTRIIFPILDTKGYVLESYDVGEKCILVLDLSEWALDIELCLEGKYSKLSKEAKGLIEKYHWRDPRKKDTAISILAALHPNKSYPFLNNKTPFEAVAEQYGMEYEDLRKIGELGIKYDRMAETLVTDIQDLIKV